MLLGAADDGFGFGFGFGFGAGFGVGVGSGAAGTAACDEHRARTLALRVWPLGNTSLHSLPRLIWSGVRLCVKGASSVNLTLPSVGLVAHMCIERK